MTATEVGGGALPLSTFRHEAWFYEGTSGFVDAIAPFVIQGVDAGEPVLVAVPPPRIAALREALGARAERVRFVDMYTLGRNPAHIIPAWHDFLTERRSPAAPVRGVGEPIWAGRGSAELAESQRHEALLNLAFADAPAFSLVCPYDVATLDDTVIGDARRSHPHLRHDDRYQRSRDYHGTNPDACLDVTLPLPAVVTHEVDFEQGTLASLRALVRDHAASFGFDPDRSADLVVAVDEIATNSVRHGGGGGVLRIWHEDDALVCEVRDGGRIRDALVGRRRPSTDRSDGYGLWLANRLCDLVRVRSSSLGTTVRLHMRAPRSGRS